MSESISDLNVLLRSLDPHLHEGVYVYSCVLFETDLSSIAVVGTFRESEGLTIILPEPDALKNKFPILFRAAWITLSVDSAFEAVGMTAAFATALGNAGISCNVVAGARHDHVFVPIERAVDAMVVLHELGKTAK